MNENQESTDPLVGEMFAYDTGNDIVTSTLSEQKLKALMQTYKNLGMRCVAAIANSSDARKYSIPDIKCYKITSLLAKSGQAKTYIIERSGTKYVLKLFSFKANNTNGIRFALQESHIMLWLSDICHYLPKVRWAGPPQGNFCKLLNGYDKEVQSSGLGLVDMSGETHNYAYDEDFVTGKTWKRFYFAIVMEYIEGPTLADLLPKATRSASNKTIAESFSLNEKKDILLDIMQSIEQLHSFGIAHCDIKPENIMLKRIQSPALGNYWKVYLLDLGLCRITDKRKFESCASLIDSDKVDTNDIRRSLTAPVVKDKDLQGEINMTPHYAAYEQMRDQPVSHLTDICIMGLVAYVWLGNLKRPIEGIENTAMYLCTFASKELMPLTNRSDIFKACLAEKSEASNIASKVSAVIAKAVRHTASERYESMSAFMTALRLAFR